MAKLVLGGRYYESYVEFMMGDNGISVKISINDPNHPGFNMAEVILEKREGEAARRFFVEGFPRRHNGGSNGGDGGDPNHK